MPGSEQHLRALAQRDAAAIPNAAFAVTFQSQNRSEQPADGLAQLDRFNVEKVAFAALERHHADRMPIVEQRHRTNGDIPEFAGKLGVSDRSNFAVVTRGMNQRDVEIEN